MERVERREGWGGKVRGEEGGKRKQLRPKDSFGISNAWNLVLEPPSRNDRT